MKIVSNSSPLITFARISRLDIVQRLYGEIVIPTAVWDEVVVAGAHHPGADAVRSSSWILQQAVMNKPLVQALRQELDAGEAEAIALAMQCGDALLLMDERLGRDTARHLGIRYLGVIGVLIEAKRRGIIQVIRPLLASLRDSAGFRISAALYQRVLRDEGES